MGKMVVSRIGELERPSDEFPRRFVPVIIDLSKWENIEPLFQTILERKLDSKEALEKWFNDLSELEAVISEERSRRYIAMTCATDDEEVEKEFLHFIENIQPRIKPYEHKAVLKMLDCPHLSELDQDRYEVLIRSSRNYAELYREENIPLSVEVAKLSQQYQKITGSMTIKYKDKELTLPQAYVFLQERDRRIRQQVWELVTERRLQYTEQLDEIFNKMLELRNQMATNAGFDNFRDFQFRSYDRFDYTPDDCFKFHDAVEKHVVPLTRQMIKDRCKSLKIDTVRPWDGGCDRLGRDKLKPFETTDKLIERCREIFGKIDSELGDDFQKMIDLGLLDLDSRKGKAPGGYQSSLNEVRLPFIFMNAVGVDRDVYTMLHEGGHAFHQFAVRNEPIIDYRSAPMEFSEVASMSLEMLGAPYLQAFYSESDAARSERDHLAGNIGLLPWVAIVDAFQHWIYTNPGHSATERNDHFVSLMNRFSSGVDWSGLDHILAHRWQEQLHIFEVPFYYIEYGIALLGALQVWRNSIEDEKGAVDAYKNALKLGGSKPLPQLFETAGVKFDFSDKTIEPLMKVVSEEVAKLAESEKL